MSFQSVNPADGNTLGEFDAFTDAELEAALAAAAAAAPLWRSRVNQRRLPQSCAMC